MAMISSDTINEIAQHLGMGMDCHYNTKTNELITVPGRQFNAEKEFLAEFKEQFAKIKKNKKDFLQIEVLDSRESFGIMEGFAAQITNESTKRKLFNALEGRKPFQNFKHLVHNSNFRQDWFDFEQSEMERIVRERLGVS